MKPQNLNDLKFKIVPILKEAGVKRSAIFGSFARGENNPDSDLDILVEMPIGKSYLDLVRLQRQVKQIIQVDVDMATFNSVSPLLKNYIDPDLIQIL